MGMTADEFDLLHYGVKGMHWGQHRSSTPKRVSTDRKKIDKALEKQKSEGTKALTNKELGDLNKRLQMETQLKKLQTSPSKNVVKKGHEHVKEALAIGGTVAALVSFAQSDQGKKISKAIDGKLIDLVIHRPDGKHYA